MKVSAEAKSVYADIIINLAWVLIVSLPDFIIGRNWLQLTTSFFLTILAMRVAIQLRTKKTMTTLNDFFTSAQIATALMIIAYALYFWLVERHLHKR